jgi:hypothetical protein
MSDNIENKVELDETIFNETPRSPSAVREVKKDSGPHKPAHIDSVAPKISSGIVPPTLPKVEAVKEEETIEEENIEKDIVKENVEEEKKEETPKEEFIYSDELIAKEIAPTEDKQSEEKLEKEFEDLVNSSITPRVNIDRALDQTAPKEETEAETDSTKVTEKDSSVQKLEKIKEVSEELLKKKTKYILYGGEDHPEEVSSLSSDSNTLSAIKRYKIKEEKISAPPGNTKITEDAFKAQYIDIANSPVIARISRVPILLSGYYCEMGAADYGDMLSLTRLVAEDGTRFSKIFAEELKIIYKHLSWCSYCDTKPGIDDWLSKTFMPDLDQFFYGIFDATFPGKTEYPITCGNTNCGHNFQVTKENRALNFALERGITADFIKGVIANKIPAEELHRNEIYKEAHTLYDKKVLSNYQYKVAYGVPTLQDIIEWLNVFDTELYESFDDFSGLVDEDAPDHSVLKLLTYIKQLTVPVIIGKSSDGKDIINFYCLDTSEKDNLKRYENRKQIVKLLMALPKEIFRELFIGDEIQMKLKTRGMIHMLHNVECPNCKSTLVRIPLDMSSIFFTEATRTVRLISQF